MVILMVADTFRAVDSLLHSSPSVSSHVIGVNSGERKTSVDILSAGLVDDKHSSLHHYINVFKYIPSNQQSLALILSVPI